MQITDSANGGALPASAPKTRRAALGLLAGTAAGALIVPAVAQADDADAPLIALLDRWREATARQRAAWDRLSELYPRTKIPRPDALLKTEFDAPWLLTKEKVGEHYVRPDTFAQIDRMLPILLSFHFEHAPIGQLVKRLDEIQAARVRHENDVRAAKEACGWFEAEREEEAAGAVEKGLRHDVAVIPARTFGGLFAKMSAIAAAVGHEKLEEDTSFEPGENVSLDQAALAVLRDFVRLAPSVPSSGAFAV